MPIPGSSDRWSNMWWRSKTCILRKARCFVTTIFIWPTKVHQNSLRLVPQLPAAKTLTDSRDSIPCIRKRSRSKMKAREFRLSSFSNKPTKNDCVIRNYLWKHFPKSRILTQSPNLWSLLVRNLHRELICHRFQILSLHETTLRQSWKPLHGHQKA